MGMKALMLLAASILLSGCVGIPIPGEEQCAEEGMILADIQMAGSKAAACTKPKDSTHDCRIKALAGSTEPLHLYNDNLPLLNTMMVIGYIAYVVPGLVFTALAVEGKKGRTAEYEELRREKLAKCEMTVPRPQVLGPSPPPSPNL